MFDKKKKFTLKKYEDLRKEKLSIFGCEVEFDWFMINLLTLIAIILVFYFSIKEINKVLNFEPEADMTAQNLLRDKKVLNRLDEIILKFEDEEKILIENVDETVSD